MFSAVIDSVLLLFLLLNPFLIVIYIIELVQDSSAFDFWKIVLRAGSISFVVFVIFAIVGNKVFVTLLHARFASFQVFGGIVFLIIGLRFVFNGPKAILTLRGEPEQIAGSLTMPIMIGPGSVSASILTGQRLNNTGAVIATFIAVFLCIATLMLLKLLHDYVKLRNEKIIERYIEVAGRIAALVVGTFSIEMIMQGVSAWIEVF